MLEGKTGVVGKWHQLFKSGSNFFKSGEWSGDNFLGASETPDWGNYFAQSPPSLDPV